MDYVHIDGLKIAGKHGHYAHERKGHQDFEVSVKVGIDVKKAGKSDKLRHSLSYSHLKAAAIEVFNSEPRYLLETLAEHIAQKILKQHKIAKDVTVTIKKLAIWKDAIPGVTITRHRQ